MIKIPYLHSEMKCVTRPEKSCNLTREYWHGNWYD